MNDMRHWITLLENELPMDDKSRMERAKQLGFTIPAYHGTASKFTAFDLEKGKAHVLGGYAPYFSGKKAESAGYAKEAGKGSKVLSCLLRLKKPLEIDQMKSVSPQLYKEVTGDEWTDKSYQPKAYYMIDDLRKKYYSEDRRETWKKIYTHLMRLGYDGIYWPNTLSDYSNGIYDKYVVFDPKNIRLTKARFDPAFAESADLMA